MTAASYERHAWGCAPQDAAQANEHARLLARRAAAGDPRARREVVLQVQARVRAIANALLPSPADADDAAQVALLEILRSIGGYRGDGPLVGWAARLAVRHVRRCVHRRRRQHEREHELDDHAPGPSSEPPLSESLPRDLRSYLGELPEDQREALVLRFALGFSFDEIADATGAPVSTIRGRIRAGSKALRQTIAREQRFGTGATP